MAETLKEAGDLIQSIKRNKEYADIVLNDVDRYTMGPLYTGRVLVTGEGENEKLTPEINSRWYGWFDNPVTLGGVNWLSRVGVLPTFFAENFTHNVEVNRDFQQGLPHVWALDERDIPSDDFMAR